MKYSELFCIACKRLPALLISGACLMLALILPSGILRAEEDAQERLKIFVSIEPQAYLVEQLGGENVQVAVLAEQGQNPHSFEPTPRQIMELGKADIYFEIGMPFERGLLAKIRGAQERIHIADMSKSIKRRIMTEEHHHADHDHHADEEHQEHGAEELDPHLWLSPPLLKQLAENTAEVLSESDPERAAEYAANLERLTAEIEAAHTRIKALLEPFHGRKFYVFHPAFGYFADAYGLRQEAVEIEGKSPTPRELAALIAQARQDGVQVIFVQPQFDRRNAETLARAIGGTVVPMNPLERDVLKNIEKMAGKIAQAMPHSVASEQKK